MAGLGKYLDKNGYNDRTDILLKHLHKVRDIAKKYGFNIYMWSVMFFRLNNNGDYYGENTVPSSVASKISQGINQVYQDYYHEDESEYAKNLDGLKVLANNDYNLVIKRLKIYADKVDIQWEKENKGVGQEVLQARIGALIQRISYAKKALLEFVSGKRDKIDQLEMEIMGNKGHSFCPQWSKTITANIMQSY